MKYKLIKRRNPSDPEGYNKLHAIPVYDDLISLKEIAKHISSRSSLTAGDILSVLINLTEDLQEYLTEGKRVELGDLGIFRLNFSSDGVETEKDFRVSMMRKIKIHYSPGKELKRQIQRIRFEKVKQ